MCNRLHYRAWRLLFYVVFTSSYTIIATDMYRRFGRCCCPQLLVQHYLRHIPEDCNHLQDECWRLVCRVGYATTNRATKNNATTNEFYKEQFLSVKSGWYYEKCCYKERGGILWTDVARVCIWGIEPSHFWLECQSSSLLYSLRFSYQYCSVTWLRVHCIKVK
jgi:hypothetical protein